MLVPREDEPDDARGNRQDEADDHPQAARPRTRFAVIALAEKVIIHRRTPESGLICGLHDTLITGDGDVRMLDQVGFPTAESGLSQTAP
jgi:hypothetical protein